MGAIEIKGMTFGQGMPKLAISLMGGERAVLEQARRGRAAGAECFEYRADFASDPYDVDAIVGATRSLARALPGNPVLFTFRTRGQGGAADLGADELAALCRTVIADGAADMVDIESWLGEAAVRELCASAREAGVVSVVSFHDAAGTPPEEELVETMLRFRAWGADIPKVAVMASSGADAAALLGAAARFGKVDGGPLAAMAMGRAGAMTRLVGEAFGSVLTFCALDSPSAPGQVPLAEARVVIERLHQVIASHRDATDAAGRFGR